MSVDSRRIERLTLGVPQASDARQATHTIHEALRLASMPGDGHPGRLFIRRIELPAFRLERGARVLANVLASRVRQARGSAVEIGDRRAGRAEVVIARDDVEPLVIALVRAAKGQRLTEWFWPQVDTRLHAKLGPMAVAAVVWRLLAERSDAAMVIPAVVGAVLDVDPQPEVFAAIDPGLGAVLVSKLGVALVDVGLWPLVLGTVVEPRWSGIVRAMVVNWGADVRARWLMTVIVRAAQPWNGMCAVLGEREVGTREGEQEDTGDGGAPRGRVEAEAEGLEQPVSARREDDPPVEVVRRSELVEMTPDDPHDPRLATLPPLPPAPVPSPHNEPPPTSAPTTHSSSPDPAPAPTRWSLFERPAPTNHGGLLFLIHPLERLGLAKFIDQHPGLQRIGFGLHVLDRIAHELEIPPDDPLRQAVRPPDFPEDIQLPSPPSFDHVLAPPPALDQAPALPSSAIDSVQHPSPSDPLTTLTQSWITALTLYLEQIDNLDLPTVVHRPATVTCTRTHVDIIFDMEASDIQLRRLGFDINPLFVRWLGRVVTFHYVFGGLLDA